MKDADKFHVLGITGLLSPAFLQHNYLENEPLKLLPHLLGGFTR